MRLFVALELGQQATTALAALASELRDRCAGWRWVRREAYHLTLRFLGEVAEHDDLRQRERWRATAAPAEPLRLRLEATGTFPPRGRPRVLWAGVRDESRGGALAALAATVEQAARELGYAPERRPFRPHLTLARAARGAKPVPPPAGIEPEAVSIAVDRLTLFRSRLAPSGATYTALERFPLQGSGPDAG